MPAIKEITVIIIIIIIIIKIIIIVTIEFMSFIEVVFLEMTSCCIMRLSFPAEYYLSSTNSPHFCVGSGRWS